MAPQVEEKFIFVVAEVISFVLSDEQYTLNINNPEAGASSSSNSIEEYSVAVIGDEHRFNSPHCWL
jgi:hypothetical protein